MVLTKEYRKIIFRDTNDSQMENMITIANLKRRRNLYFIALLAVVPLAAARYRAASGRVRIYVQRRTETILFVRKPINRAQENGIWPGFNSVRWPPRIDNVPQPTYGQIISIICIRRN